MTVAKARHMKFSRYNGASVTCIASSCHMDYVALDNVLIDLESAYTEIDVYNY